MKEIRIQREDETLLAPSISFFKSRSCTQSTTSTGSADPSLPEILQYEGNRQKRNNSISQCKAVTYVMGIV